ncbi:MAG: T9SS type A sorting domain-containing protein [Chitinophagaceae bacterium]
MYYRIKVVDNDGQITYSDVKMIRQANKLMNILVYPNPGKDVINVVMPETNGVVNVVLDDFSGKTIKRWTGMKAGNMQLTNLLPGVYILRVNVVATGEQAVAKIVVQ